MKIHFPHLCIELSKTKTIVIVGEIFVLVQTSFQRCVFSIHDTCDLHVIYWFPIGLCRAKYFTRGSGWIICKTSVLSSFLFASMIEFSLYFSLESKSIVVCLIGILRFIFSKLVFTRKARKPKKCQPSTLDLHT